MSGSAACIGICVGLLVFFLIIVIVIVVVVVVLLTPHVSIDAYTAEIRYDYNYGHVFNTREVVLSSYKWFDEQAYDGEIFSRVYKKDYDGLTYLCSRVGDHDNCYKLSSDGAAGYTVPRAMSKEEKKVDCPAIHDPVLPGSSKRTLDKCDMYVYDYTGSDYSYYREDWVEHDSEYPVKQIAIYYNKKGVLEYNMTAEFTSFDGKVPTNDTGLKDPEGAVIFDFTKGTTGSSSLSRMFSKVSDKVKSIFSKSSPKKLNVAAEATKERFQDEKLFRKLTNLRPFVPINGPIDSAPASMKLRDDIPETFDARDNWPLCKDVIGNITNQESCGSCWAMSTASVLSDRACINNISNAIMSPQYMMSCYPNQLSCNGGYVATVWKDVIKYGSVSWKCFPFVAADNACPTKCKDGTPISDANILKTKSFYSPWAKDADERVKAIQTEIMNHGPVTVSMLVFDGFYDYTSGVYTRKSSEEYSGGHMVRIIGWGKDGSTKYWLVANSWDTDWGLDGLFKIRLGTNECGIEGAVIAGLF